MANRTEVRTLSMNAEDVKLFRRIQKFIEEAEGQVTFTLIWRRALRALAREMGV